MDCSVQQKQDFTAILFQHQDSYQNPQSIINFIPNLNNDKKVRICAWNQHSYRQDQQFSQQMRMSPGFQHQKQRIQQFLSNIKIKNGQFSKFKSKYKTKKRNSVHDNLQNQKNDLFLPLNNTIITFPKSRSQNRKLQNQQKIILQKLYRKRQKSKIIPKQISIDPFAALTTVKHIYPSKDYLSKNRSFVQDCSSTKVYNIQQKTIRQISGFKRRFSNSYYKKLTGVFQINGDNQKLFKLDQKNHSSKNQNHLQTIDRSSKKVNSLSDQTDNLLPNQLYKTLYTKQKNNKMSFGYQKEFSIDKVRQQAKISHLNRTKSIQNNQIQLLGSTITKWKNKAEEKLKQKEFSKD